MSGGDFAGAAARSATADDAPARADDRRAAVAELMRAHGEAVLGFCLRVLGDRALAEDVRQQTFLEAYRDFDRFHERSSRQAWLFSIASNRCIDALRRRRMRSKWVDSSDASIVRAADRTTGPGERLERAELTRALEDCLQSLTPEVRVTVLMRFQTGFTYEELARPLASRADTLQMRVARALAKLRECLETKGWADD